MRSAFKPLAVVLAIVVVMICVSLYRMKSAGSIHLTGWETDLPRAESESRRSGKPILAYFTADWCEPCQRMKQETFPDPGVVAAMQAYIPLVIDMSELTPNELATRCGVQFFPTFAILDAAGQPQGTGMAGFVPAGDFAAWLRQSPALPATTHP